MVFVASYFLFTRIDKITLHGSFLVVGSVRLPFYNVEIIDLGVSLELIDLCV